MRWIRYAIRDTWKLTFARLVELINTLEEVWSNGVKYFSVSNRLFRRKVLREKCFDTLYKPENIAASYQTWRN